MNHMVITIGCEHGSGGPEIGKMLADDLGLEYYDRPLIDKIIQEVGLSKDVLDKAYEAKAIKGRVDAGTGGMKARSNYSDLTERVVFIQFEVIKKLAERSSCVIIGRCSDYILRDRDDCLNIFTYAPKEMRIARIMAQRNVSAERAEEIMLENDRTDHARYEYMTGTYRGDRRNRHMLIDSSVLGLEGTTEYIKELITRRFGEI